MARQKRSNDMNVIGHDRKHMKIVRLTMTMLQDLCDTFSQTRRAQRTASVPRCEISLDALVIKSTKLCYFFR